MEYKSFINYGSSLGPITKEQFVEFHEMSPEKYEVIALKLTGEICDNVSYDIKGPAKIVMIDNSIKSNKEKFQLESILTIEQGEKIEFYRDPKVDDDESELYMYNGEDAFYLLVRNDNNDIIGRLEIMNEAYMVDENILESTIGFKTIDKFNDFIYKKLNIDISNAYLWINND